MVLEVFVYSSWFIFGSLSAPFLTQFLAHFWPDLGSFLVPFWAQFWAHFLIFGILLILCGKLDFRLASRPKTRSDLVFDLGGEKIFEAQE